MTYENNLYLHESHGLYDLDQKGKQVNVSFEFKNIIPQISMYNCDIWIFLSHLEL